jgi:hypothetical protein
LPQRTAITTGDPPALPARCRPIVAWQASPR